MSKLLERISPVEAGVDPKAIQGFLDQIEKNHVHLHSYMMLKGNKVFAEGSYFPCHRDDLHMLFSLSKSFTSTAVGFAVQEGLLSLDDLVVDFFKEELAAVPETAVCENMKKMTVRHLLTMNTGQTDAEDDLLSDFSRDWVVSFLTSPVEKEPGSWFLYNTRATYMAGVIVQKLTGQGLLEYLRPRLFDPLGCSEGIWWEKSPQGYHTGGFGLNLTVDDIARFAIFVKDRGVFDGQRLLNAKWLEEATSKWSDTSLTWEGEGAYGYGYQFWMNHVPGTYRGDGAFGQYCVIFPEQDMIFAATAGQLDMQQILDAFWENVYAYVIQPRKSPLEVSAAKIEAIEKNQKNLVLQTYYEETVDSKELSLPEEILGKRYLLEENPIHMIVLGFDKGCEQGEYLVTIGNGKCLDQICVSAKEWKAGKLILDPESVNLEKAVFRDGLYENLYAKGCTKDGVLYLDIIFPETAFQDTWKVTFDKNKIHLNIHRNAGFVPVDVDGDGIAEA